MTKPQDLTNKQLAAELNEPLPHAWAIKEAARRLVAHSSETERLRDALRQVVSDYDDWAMNVQDHTVDNARAALEYVDET